jgi:hypothetical protein
MPRNCTVRRSSDCSGGLCLKRRHKRMAQPLSHSSVFSESQRLRSTTRGKFIKSAFPASVNAIIFSRLSFMSNKDYYGQQQGGYPQQQQYYPPQGAIFSPLIAARVWLRGVKKSQGHRLVRVVTIPSNPSRPTSRVILDNLASNHSPSLRRFMCTFGLPCKTLSANPRCALLFFRQQPPPQKKDDFCAACLTGVCLCCCAEGAWPCCYVLGLLGAYEPHRTSRQSFAHAFSK